MLGRDGFYGSVTRVAGQQDDLCPVAGLEFLHDVPDMNLDGAFAHAELICDDLVLLALFQALQHIQLARRELNGLAATISGTSG